MRVGARLEASDRRDVLSLFLMPEISQMSIWDPAAAKVR
jgi:hypothetical protein